MKCIVLILLFLLPANLVAADPVPNSRLPRDEADLKYWLRNMVWDHGFSTAEIRAATGLAEGDIEAALGRFRIRPHNGPKTAPDILKVRPYPGGRHPRVGFLDGAVEPQRETKISVFTPWDPQAYVVADVPEAIWSNLGLTYLAHTHVPTVWTEKGVALEPLEWERQADGVLVMERRLPNGIVFGTRVVPRKDHVAMEQWLRNGTPSVLTGMRVQNCVMLKAAPGFELLTKENKVLRNPYAACRNTDGTRWVITAWEPCHRPWGNDKCPCLHSDPKFPDAKPGETVRLKGWLSFYEGTDLDQELERIDATGWRQGR